MKAIFKPTVITALIAVSFGAAALIAQNNGQPVLRGQNRADRIPGQYIVVLKPGASAAALTNRHGLAPEHMYGNALNGFAGAFSARQLEALLDDPQVEFLEEDQVVTIGAQTVTPGIVRVGGTLTNAYATGATVDADIAIIDTGISLTHPDLNVFRNVSFVSGVKNGNDDQGHGTHCAGIAAARNNTAGVVGVAPGARLWAVKVLNRNGTGTMSGVIKGVDYVKTHAGAIEAANMSLGGGNSDALNLAIKNATDAGVVFAVAAGNAAANAATTSPANSPNVLCVSAIVDTNGTAGGGGPATTYGADDTFATFSNFGTVVDIAAPGVDILSTYKGGAYALMSGTSMASPHVAGAIGLYLSARAKPTNGTQAAAVRAAIIAAGTPGAFPGDPDMVAEPLLNVSAF